MPTLYHHVYYIYWKCQDSTNVFKRVKVTREEKREKTNEKYN